MIACFLAVEIAVTVALSIAQNSNAVYLLRKQSHQTCPLPLKYSLSFMHTENTRFSLSAVTRIVSSAAVVTVSRGWYESRSESSIVSELFIVLTVN